MEHFYSHAREGRDDGLSGSFKAVDISTHTPARGVTGSAFNFLIDNFHFYSHAREGRDGRPRSNETGNTDFYSHAREGRDQGYNVDLMANTDFYSHAREGRDQFSFAFIHASSDFYSHAREGRDYREKRWYYEPEISTHTPARGVTPIFCILGRSRHHITQGGLIFLMILNHTSIKNYIFPGEPSGDFGVIEGSLFCEWISI